MKTTFPIDKVYAIVREEFGRNHMPVVDLIAVQSNDPYRILVATILSARTKDQTTAAASARLFDKAPTMSALAKLPITRIEKCIYPVGFWKQKAGYLHALPAALDTFFSGQIPSTIDELVRLPGVGRKTANLVVALAFNKPAICVDVHVHRIFNRLGYVKTTTPFETEMALRSQLPVKYWIGINASLVSFGQNTCLPVNPRCDRCPLAEFCCKVGVRNHRTGKRGSIHA